MDYLVKTIAECVVALFAAIFVSLFAYRCVTADLTTSSANRAESATGPAVSPQTTSWSLTFNNFPVELHICLCII